MIGSFFHFWHESSHNSDWPNPAHGDKIARVLHHQHSALALPFRTWKPSGGSSQATETLDANDPIKAYKMRGSL
jgi:hypothetical protein